MGKNLINLKTELENFDSHFIKAKKWINIHELEKMKDLSENHQRLTHIPKLVIESNPNVKQWHSYMAEVMLYLEKNHLDAEKITVGIEKEQVTIKAQTEETELQYNKRLTSYLLNLKKKINDGKIKEKETIEQLSCADENFKCKKRLADAQEYLQLAESFLPVIEEKIELHSPVKQLNEIKMYKIFNAIEKNTVEDLKTMFIGNTYMLDVIKKTDEQVNSIYKDIKMSVEGFYNENKTLSEKDFARKVAHYRSGRGITSLMLSLYVKEQLQHGKLAVDNKENAEINYKQFAIEVYKKLYTINDKDTLKTPSQNRLVR